MPEQLVSELGLKTKPPEEGGGLLGRMSGNILAEKRRADHQLAVMAQKMVDLIDESAKDEQSRRVPFVLRCMIVVGFLLVVYVSLVFTPAAKVADLSWLGEFGGLILWLTFALAIALSALFLLANTEGSGKTAAGFLAALLTGSVGAAFSPSIQGSYWVLQIFGRGADDWKLWPMTFAVVVAGFTARLLVPQRTGEWRSALARFIGIATIAFLAGWLVVVSCRVDSFLQTGARFQQEFLDEIGIDPDEFDLATEESAPEESLSSLVAESPNPELTQAALLRLERHLDRVAHVADWIRLRILLSGLFFGTLLFLGGIVAIALLWIRIEFRNRNRGVLFQFASDEAIHASRARRRLQLFLPQWLGIASALSRIVWRPLGEVTEFGQRATEPLDVDAELLKLEVAELRLTPHGEEVLLERLRALIVRPGWLTDQYRRAADAHVENDPRLLAAELPREEWPRPETDPHTPALQDVLDGNADGMRWDFVRNLYGGGLDGALQAKLSEHSPAEIYRVLLDSEQAATVRELTPQGSDSDQYGSSQTFFYDVLPTGRPSLPGGLVKQTFIANDERARMTPFICWPDELLPDVVIDGERLDSEITDFGGAVITAVRCDISSPFSLSDLPTFERTTFDDDEVEAPDEPTGL